MNLKKLTDPVAVYRKLKRILYLKRMHRIFIEREFHFEKYDLAVNHSNEIFFNEFTFSYLKKVGLCLNKDKVDVEREFSDQCLKKRFRFLEHWFDFKKKIIWNHDPVSNKLWQNIYSFYIIYIGAQRLSDIKLPWELAKMQYIFILGKTYIYTDDEKYAKEIICHMDSWISSNPPFRGIHWISGFEVGIRVISFIMAYPFIKKFVEPLFLKKYLSSIYLQTQFIEDNLSLKEYANNHLIGEAFALVLSGMFLDCDKSMRWYKIGLKLLSDEVIKQNHNDGVNKEQSYSYHRYVLDYYYLLIILLRKNNRTYPSHIDRYIQKMTEFLAFSVTPDRGMPDFGDADDARGIYIKVDGERDYTGIFALGAVLFRRHDFKFFSTEICPEEVLWLIGEEGVKDFYALNADEPVKKNYDFADGGYYIFRDGFHEKSNYLAFDCGPLCSGDGGHGHADALSFQLSISGERYFVDTGTYSYNLDYEIRNYFRSTRAHNTVTVDGYDQSEIKDRMSWETFAGAKLLTRQSSTYFQLIGGMHDGYLRLEDPVIHQRFMFYDRKATWVIGDFFSCQRSHVYEHLLHLEDDCTPFNTVEQNNKVEIKKKEKSIYVYYPVSGEDVLLIKGQENPFRLGWISKRYGEFHKTYSLYYKSQRNGNTSMVTAITDDPNIAFIDKSEKALSFQLDELSSSTHFFYAPSNNGPWSSDDIQFHGGLLFYKKSHDMHDANVVEGYQIKSLAIEKIGSVECSHNIDCIVISGNRVSITVDDACIKQLSYHFSSEFSVEINNKKLT